MEVGMRRVRQASAWMVIAATLIACATVGCGRGKIRSAEEYLAIIESPSPRIAAESYAWGPIYEASERFEPRPRDVPLLVAAIVDRSKFRSVRLNCYCVIANTADERYLRQVFDAIWGDLSPREKLAIAGRAPGILHHRYDILKGLTVRERIKWIEENKCINDFLVGSYVSRTASRGR